MRALLGVLHLATRRRHGLPVDGLALWEAPLDGVAAETQAWSDEVEQRMDAGDAEGALSHYMKDMPPEWLADAKASSEWGEIAAGVVSLRADGQSLAWAVAALEDGVLGGIRKPVLAMYGTETFPEMPRGGAHRRSHPGAIEKAVPGAEHTWQPEPMAAELSTFVKACQQPSPTSTITPVRRYSTVP